ncbi:MAG: hypothetical protein QOK43_2552 [Acidimicrobiaceae bacterium]|nr:hypothetical protein [Acidimicrobiaceae bacterium]
MLRWGIRLAALAVMAVLAYLAVTFVQVWTVSRRDEARRAQAIVVFGAAQYQGKPSPVLRARLDHAVALYRKGYADTLVVTGGRLPNDTSGYTEARASAEYLVGRGVPDSAILREVSGRNSWQSLASATAFLKRRHVSRVILVSDGFHALRIRAMADELGLTAYTSPARASPIHGMGKLPYLAKETVAVALGRVIGFRRVAGIDRRVRNVSAVSVDWLH